MVRDRMKLPKMYVYVGIWIEKLIKVLLTEFRKKKSLQIQSSLALIQVST